MASDVPLNEKDRRGLSYCEVYWMQYSKLVTAEMLHDDLGWKRKDASDWLLSQPIREAFQRRGIPEFSTNELLPEQVALANCLLDFADRRSYNKKFVDLGVTTAKYQVWLKQPAFKQYMMQRSESLLGDALPEAHMALIDNVRRGDLQSLKLYYDMTGRFTSRDNSVDIPQLLGQILEIVSKYVTSPDALKAIAGDFEKLGRVDTPGNVVQGDVIDTPVAKALPTGTL